MAITMLKLKLDFADDPELPGRLNELAGLCREARNAAMVDWLLRQNGKEPSKKQAGKGRKGTGLSESTKLYHAMTSAVPQLGTSVISSLAQQINSNLGAKLDWRRGEEKAVRRRDAILSGDDRVPWYTDQSIPVANKHTYIVFRDTCQITAKDLSRGGNDTFAVSLKDVPTGIKNILHDLEDGKRKLCDSYLRCVRDKWYWYLPVRFEAEPLESDRQAVLEPVIPDGQVGQQDRPFRLRLPGRKPWYIGDGRYLEAQTSRLEGARKMIGWRYRQRQGAGHGRKKVDEAMVKRARQLRNIVNEVRRRMINDVVKQCKRAQCGTVVYREPTNPAKDKTWFADRKLTWDWTRFTGDLKNALSRAGISVKVCKLKIGEILEAEKSGDGV